MGEDALKIDNKDVPNTPEERIKDLMALPLSQKQVFVPQVGLQLRLGAFIYKVTFTNPSQLRFTATLSDVIIEGVNDGESNVSPIISPITGKGILKTDD